MVQPEEQVRAALDIESGERGERRVNRRLCTRQQSHMITSDDGWKLLAECIPTDLSLLHVLRNISRLSPIARPLRLDCNFAPAYKAVGGRRRRCLRTASPSRFVPPSLVFSCANHQFVCARRQVVKLYLYNNKHALALSHQNSHMRNAADFSRGWGIGQETFEFWSWLARQYVFCLFFSPYTLTWRPHHGVDPVY